MKAVNKYRIAGFLVIALFILFAAKDRALMGGADAGRLAVVGELGVYGVFAITDSPLRSTDRVIFEGEKYSDKPLFLPWCAALAYRVWHNFTGWNMRMDQHGSIWLLTVVLNLLTDYLLFLCFFNRLRRIRQGGRMVKFLLSLGLIFTTWIGSYSTAFMHHNVTALALLGAWTAVEKFRLEPTVIAAAAAGFCAGAAGVVELPVGFFSGVAVLTAVAVSAPTGERMRMTGAAALSGIVMLIWLLLINFYAYGDFRPLYIVPGGTYAPPTAWKDGMAVYAADCLFLTRGLFSYQPFLLLALPGWLLWRREFSPGQQILLLMVPVTVLFYLCFTNEYGGWGYGFRYFIPLIPLIYLCACRCFLALPPVWRAVCVPLLAWGLVTSMIGAVSPNCVAYEGARTEDGHFTQTIQSTFSGNLLEFLQHYAPDSALMRRMKEHYGEENVRLFCFWQAVNLDRRDPRLGIESRDQALAEMPIFRK